MRTRSPTRKGPGFFQIHGSIMRGFTIVVLLYQGFVPITVGGRQDTRNRAGTFRVEVAAEALELRRQQQRVGLVELLRRRALPWSRTSHQAMDTLDLVQSGRAIRAPALESEGGHQWTIREV